MMFKMAILNLIRSKGKTLLFTALIIALTITLSLGVNVWAAIQQFLNQADDFYTTVASFEYFGKDYPQANVIDHEMAEDLKNFDLSPLKNDPAVLEWHQPKQNFASIEGYWRSDSLMVNRDFILLMVNNINFIDSYDSYVGTVAKVLYAHRINENTKIRLSKDFGEFDKDKSYIIHGVINPDGLTIPFIIPQAFGIDISAFDNPNLATVYPMPDLKPGENRVIPDDYFRVAELMKTQSNAVLVHCDDHPESMIAFNQEILHLTQGRFFTNEEIAQGSRVIIIPEFTATRLYKVPGDTLNLSILLPETQYKEKYAQDFKIVGITNTAEGYEWQTFIPENTDFPSLDQPVGYTFAWAIIENAKSNAFFLRANALMHDRFIMALYDQGYANTAVPFQNIFRIAKLITIICAILMTVVLIFFGYVFVYRQRETGQTMLLLGTGNMRVIAYFLLGSGILALIGALIGAIIGFQFSDRVLTFVGETVSGQQLLDQRFSNSLLSFSRSLEFAPEFGIDFFLKLGLIVFLCAMGSCLFFIIQSFSMQPKTKRRGSNTPGILTKTSSLGGGSLKYALLSLSRGGWRSLLVIGLATGMVLFFGQLSHTAQQYHDELEHIYDNAIVYGRYTDLYGKQIDDLQVSMANVYDLKNTGLIDQLSVALKIHGRILGVPLRKDGTTEDIEPFVVSTNEFVYKAQENMFTKLGGAFEYNYVSDIYKAPEFFYLENAPITFLDGYNGDFFYARNDMPEARYCVISDKLMQEHGISLGDTVRVVKFTSKELWAMPGDTLDSLDYKVVGSYPQQGNNATLYVPLTNVIDPTELFDPNNNLDSLRAKTKYPEYLAQYSKYELLQMMTFDSTTFKLNDARKLSTLKDFLEEYGYSQVNNISKLRTVVVLNDAALLLTVSSIQQQISYIGVLHPVLVILCGIIALVISWLLIVNRRIEMATMRGLGATHWTIFNSFFFEQLTLCLLGIVIGLAIWIIWRGVPSLTHLYLILGFMACYFAGTTIAILSSLTKKLLTLLTEKE